MNPTHKHLPTDSLVFPDGYDEAELELLPEGFWEDFDMKFALSKVRVERDRLLAASDHPPLMERPKADQPLWKAYRQALRDLPAKTTDPFNPEWPTPPEM